MKPSVRGELVDLHRRTVSSPGPGGRAAPRAPRSTAAPRRAGRPSPWSGARRRPGCAPRRWRRTRRGRRARRPRSGRRPRTGRSSLGSNGWRITGTSVPGHAVEPGPVVGAGQAESREARGPASSTSGSTTSTAAGCPRPAPGRTCGWRRPRAPRGPTRRTAPTRGSTSAVPSSSGTSDRPCVRCSGATPKTSQSVAWRSTVVVSASQVPGATPGHATSSGMWPSSGCTGTCGLPQMPRSPR